MPDEATTPQTQPPLPEPPIDESGMATAYTNWYRVMGTPEELMLDFGLTPNLGVVTPDPIQVSQRMVMSYYTAKRLLAHLHLAIQRFEGNFGSVEIDIVRRIKRSGEPGASAPGGATPSGG